VSETQMLTVAASLVATLFGLLVALLGWLGSKIYNKLDEMNLTMHTIASDLHEKINDLDRRVTKVETRCESNH